MDHWKKHPGEKWIVILCAVVIVAGIAVLVWRWGQ